MKNRRLSQVTVDKQNRFSLLGKRTGDINGNSRFTLVLVGTCDNKYLVAFFVLDVFKLCSYRLKAFDKGKADLCRVGNKQGTLRSFLFLIEQSRFLFKQRDRAENGNVDISPEIVKSKHRVCCNCHNKDYKHNNYRTENKSVNRLGYRIVRVADNRCCRIFYKLNGNSVIIALNVFREFLKYNLQRSLAISLVRTGNIYAKESIDSRIFNG